MNCLGFHCSSKDNLKGFPLPQKSSCLKMPEAMHKIMETLKPVDTEKCRQGKATIGDVDSQEYLRLITVQ